MNPDIRVDVSFKDHSKRKRLRMKLGPGATDYILDLWLSARELRPDGVLAGWDPLDIAINAGWQDDPHRFVQVLVEEGWLDVLDDGTYKIHDWEEHQSWSVGAKERSEKARKAAQKKWGDLHKNDEGCSEHARGNAQTPKIDARSIEKHGFSNAPLLSFSSPFPSPPSLTSPEEEEPPPPKSSSSTEPEEVGGGEPAREHEEAGLDEVLDEYEEAWPVDGTKSQLCRAYQRLPADRKDWLLYAVRETKRHHKRKRIDDPMGYVCGILERWEMNGECDYGDKPRNRGQPKEHDPEKYFKGKFGHLVQR